MAIKKYLRFATSLVFAAAAAFMALETAATQEYKLNFDDVAMGTLPSGWKIDATNPGGKLAAWTVAADGNAASKPNVLTIARINDTSGDVFNLCWTKDVSFQNGTIAVAVRADKGREDQGGGVVWRAQDAGNYYLARYNPLESNLRLYVVKDGRRKQLASAERLDVKTGEWFKLKIVQQGDQIEASLDGRKYLQATDATFTGAGGIGLWSKADAASSFDDLAVTAP